jgi:hypothetical protein
MILGKIRGESHDVQFGRTVESVRLRVGLVQLTRQSQPHNRGVRRSMSIRQIWHTGKLG